MCLLPLFECKNVLYFPILTLLPTMTDFRDWDVFLLLFASKQIVCSLQERHKGQFLSTLPPSPFTWCWDGGRAAVWWDRRRKRKGGVRGPVTDTLSCPEPLRQSALPIVRQHPFLYPSPTLSAPCCAPIQQIVSGGPDVDLFLQVPYL